MRLVTVGLIFTPIAMIGADLAAYAGLLPTVLLENGALCVLGWVIWYLVTRAFPAHMRAQEAAQKAYLEDQQNVRRDFRSSLDGMSQSLDNLATATAGCPANNRNDSPGAS